MVNSTSAVAVLLLIMSNYGTSGFSSSFTEIHGLNGLSCLSRGSPSNLNQHFHRLSSSSMSMSMSISPSATTLSSPSSSSSSPLCTRERISHHQRHYHRNHSVMMSSVGQNEDGKQPKKKRQFLAKLNPLKALLIISNRLNKSQSKLRTRFKSLSKKGKLLFTIQIMTLMILFGTGSRQIVSSVRGTSVGSVKVMRAKPVEVPYSVFMDMVEKSGQVRSAIISNQQLALSTTTNIYGIILSGCHHTYANTHAYTYTHAYAYAYTVLTCLM